MTVTLTPQAEQIVRNVLTKRPEQSPEQIIEQALLSFEPEQATSPTYRQRTPEQFRNWLEQLRKNAVAVPHLRNETYSREMIYQDHD